MADFYREIYCYEGLTVEVRASVKEDIRWLTEFLEPSFDRQAGHPDVQVELDSDRQRYEQLMHCGPRTTTMDTFILDTRVVSLPAWNTQGSDVVLHDEQHELFYIIKDRRIRLLTGNYTRRTRSRLMRVVRELAMGVSQSTDGRFLHASSFSSNGRAGIITGPKGAGKTSLLTYILINSSANFLANDRLLVRPHGEEIRLTGMPTIVSIRPGTFELFPGLLELLNARRFNARSTMAECDDTKAPRPQIWEGGRRGLSPLQYCSLMECAAIGEARAVVAIFPRQTGSSGGLSLQRLTPDAAEILLRDCMFENISPNRLSEAFTHIPSRFLPSRAMSDLELCRAISKKLEAYECLLGNDAFADPEGARRILRLLGNSRRGDSGVEQVATTMSR